MRHIKLPYVFWEWATESIAAPLLGLGASLEQAFGCTLAELQARYDRMILIDRRAECASLVDAFDARMEEQFDALSAKIDALRWFIVGAAVVACLVASVATKVFG